MCFKKALLTHINLHYTRYIVRPFVPNPRQCKRCHTLRHLESACRSREKYCRNCGIFHDLDLECATKCVNCKSPNHDAYDRSCPSWISLKKAISLSIANGISVKEAESLLQKAFTLSKETTTNSRSFASVVANKDDKIRDLQRLFSDLQTKVTALESTTIPTIRSDILELKEHTGGLTEIVTTLKSDMATHFSSLKSDLL